MKLDDIKALLDTVVIEKGNSGLSHVSKPDVLLQVRATLILRYENTVNDVGIKKLLNEIPPEVSIDNFRKICALVQAMIASGYE